MAAVALDVAGPLLAGAAASGRSPPTVGPVAMGRSRRGAQAMVAAGPGVDGTRGRAQREESDVKDTAAAAVEGVVKAAGVVIMMSTTEMLDPALEMLGRALTEGRTMAVVAGAGVVAGKMDVAAKRAHLVTCSGIWLTSFAERPPYERCVAYLQ